jgi:acetamidase/formamidase
MSIHHTLIGDAGTVHRGAFAADIPPVLTIKSGNTIEITTLSGATEDLPEPSQGFTVRPEHRNLLDKVPPGEGPHLMTGPITVEGAMPGDELVVEIQAMDLADNWGWNVIKPDKGTLPEDFPDLRRIHVALDQKRRIVNMPWGLEIPAVPFFGVIGVAPAPADGRLTSVIPRSWGGNIDCKHLGAGATLHLPVFNKGALFSVGDGHAVQGDGEVCITAIETGLRGTVRLSVEKNTGINRPWAETATHVVTMAFDPDLNIASKDALREMIKYIVRATGLSAEDAYSLCSVAADVHVTQLVNVSKGIHVMLAKTYLRGH